MLSGGGGGSADCADAIAGKFGFEDQPGAKFKLAFPHQVAHTEQQTCTFVD